MPSRGPVTDPYLALEIALSVIAVVVILVSGMYILRRVRARRAELAGDLERSTRFLEDRAYNQARIAKAEADVLERRGVDVRAPRRLLDQAEAALGRHDGDDGLRLARSAHELLVKLKDAPGPAPAPRTSPRGPEAPGSAGGDLPVPAAWAPSTSPGASDGSDGPPRPSPLPRNKAESRFQMKLLATEVDAAERDRPGAAPTTEARGLLAEAEAAFGRGDFTGALGLALKGRRKAGGRLETLPPPPGKAHPAEPLPAERPANAGIPSPDDLDASSSPCPACDAPVKAADRFCRACGAPRVADRCPQCGSPIVAADRFCGGCGRSLPGVPA